MIADADRVDIRLLGPIELTVGEEVVDVGATQQRLVLAALAADAGRPVGVASLIDRLWDEAPDHPRRALQVYISRLRRLLDDAAGGGTSPVQVVRRSGAYLLDVERDRVDIHRFRQLVEQARGVQCSDVEQAALLGSAAELWRGVPLADLPGQWAGRLRTSWHQEYLDAMAAWANAASRVGDPGVVLPRLTALVREHPLVESLAAAFIRVLCAAGRASDALDHYGVVRRRLADELGADPAMELQQLYRQLLSADSGPPDVARSVAPREVPRELPAPPSMFVGRASELAELDRVDDASTVVIAAIDGMAGIGKTALAVYAAHRIADRYPDGQIFIDLHGYSQDMAPVQSGDALDRMLRALGVPGEQIPASLDERAGLYRTRLADRQMLIVLDNAATEEQLTPLLPGTPGCLVFVTSRRRLAGLDQTHTVSLEVLSAPDAVALLTRTAGADRLAGQPSALVAETVELCGRLPLAVRLAAARLRSHPTWTVAHLADRLREHRNRLAELEVGPRSVTAALDLSYQQLSIDQQRGYRLLGLHPGPDIDAHATAALIDTTPESARHVLDQLLDVHLVQEPVPGRYAFHDLVRAHAIHTARTTDPDTDRRDALTGLFDYLRHTAALAMDLAYPYERERRPQVPPLDRASLLLPDSIRATAWLDGELSNLLAVAGHAADHGWPQHTVQLSGILQLHVRTRGRYTSAEALHDQALSTARATGDHAGELDALTGLGYVHRLQGRFVSATNHYQHALQIAQAIGHRAAELEARNGIGRVDRLQGRYTAASDHYQRALQIAQEIGHHAGELDARNGLGQVHLLQGLYPPATDHFQRALHIGQAIGHRAGELEARNGLGQVHLLQCQYQSASDHYEQALRLANTIGHRAGELNARTGLGLIHVLQGQYAPAADHYRRILDIAREIDDRNYQYEALQGLGRLHHTAGRPHDALVHHQQALTLATELQQPTDQVRGHDGLAHAHSALNQPEQARQHWQRALDILAGLGTDHTDEAEADMPTIRAHLADLDRSPPSTRT